MHAIFDAGSPVRGEAADGLPLPRPRGRRRRGLHDRLLDLLVAAQPPRPHDGLATAIVATYLDGEAAVAHVLSDPDHHAATLRALAGLIRPLFEDTP